MWHRRGKNFLVEVYHHTVPQTELESDMARWGGEGPHRWAVYAYIYPDHPRFAMFNGPDLWQEATQGLALHGYCSLLNYPMYEGKVTSVKVGADYHHLHDEHFTRYATKEEAAEVFNDADQLFDILQAQAKRGAACETT